VDKRFGGQVPLSPGYSLFSRGKKEGQKRKKNISLSFSVPLHRLLQASVVCAKIDS